MTYEILRFHECFRGLLCWACWLGTLAWLVERNGFAEHEFGCVQITTRCHYTSVYNTVSFFVYNIRTIILRIFFIWINRGQLLDFWSMRLCAAVRPRSFRFGGGIGTIDFANLGGQFSSLGNLKRDGDLFSHMILLVLSKFIWCIYIRYD